MQKYKCVGDVCLTGMMGPVGTHSLCVYPCILRKAFHCTRKTLPSEHQVFECMFQKTKLRGDDGPRFRKLAHISCVYTHLFPPTAGFILKRHVFIGINFNFLASNLSMQLPTTILNNGSCIRLGTGWSGSCHQLSMKITPSGVL